jgi:hypothetical protein
MADINFVIISNIKTGGNTLAANIDFMAVMKCHQSVFATDSINWGTIKPPSWIVQQRDANVAPFIDYIYTYPYIDTQAIGFLLLKNENIDALTECKQNVSKKILYRRKDKLRRYLGELMLATITQSQIAIGNEYTTPDLTFDIDIAAMLDDFQADDDFFNDVKDGITASEKDYIEVIHEFMVEDPVTNKQLILDYLGYSGSATIEDVYAPSPEKPLSTLITNYNDVKAAVLDSPWAADITFDV